ncbi:hypothetical protein [Paraburkholderia fungorum]|uniref:hypothetical protein n=1 Tax=Paraburkholderia fungorum TaxID=134537 RepID=UPI0038BCAB50
MNTLFRSTLLAAVFVLPTVAFAEPVVNVTETQVETIAYEVVGPDSAQVHTNPARNHVGTYAGTLSATDLNPAANVGLKSIYVGH